MQKKGNTLQNTFNTIYTEESNAIFRFCYTRVSSREQALDLTQETFLRLWQTLSDGKTVSNYRAFLFTVARHLIIDWYRKKKSLSLEGLAEEDETKSYADPSDGSTNIDRELDAEGRYVKEKIQLLDATYRDAIHLRFVEGLPPTVIGRILGISTNAVSVRINRGIEKLRFLTGYDIDTDGIA
ncbi:MAG: sigma-70 family RNA polymerase sigma factor [Patescibacteria group bacterium]